MDDFELENTRVYTLLDIADESLPTPSSSTTVPASRSMSAADLRAPERSRFLESIDFDGPGSSAISTSERKMTAVPKVTFYEPPEKRSTLMVNRKLQMKP